LVPLPFTYHQEHVTPEGMRSKFSTDCKGNVILEWKVNNGLEWEPRLRWKIEDALSGKEGLSMTDMAPHLDVVAQEDSIFSKKLIVCLLSRDRKRTVAGSSYKITGAPRFGGPDTDSQEIPVDKRDCLDLAEIQKILLRDFSIPLEETSDLDLEKSNSKDAVDIWASQ